MIVWEAGYDAARRDNRICAALYAKCNLKPAGCCGLNVCAERDSRRGATDAPCR